MKSKINEISRTITWTFDDGLPDVTFEVVRASPENTAYAALHGFKQRIGDNAAISKTKDNGYVVTEAMRREAIVEMVEHYHTATGDSWDITERKPKHNPAIQAMADRLGIPYEVAAARNVGDMLDEIAAMVKS